MNKFSISLQDLVSKYKRSDNLEALEEIRSYLTERDVSLPGVPEGKAMQAIQVALYMQDIYAAAKNGYPPARARVAAYTQKSVLVEGTGTLGGVFVPDETHYALMDLIEGQSKLLPFVQKFDMHDKKMIVPKSDGKIGVAWHDESEAITESNPTFGSAVLENFRLDAYTKTTNELLADESIGVAGILASQFSEACAQKIDESYLVGDGTSAYGGFSGIFTAAAGYSQVFDAGSTNFSEILVSDLFEAYHQVPSYIREYESGGFFVMHSDIKKFLELETQNSKYIIPAYGTSDLKVHGKYPIIETHQAYAAADTDVSKACAAFVVPKAALLFGARARTETLVDPFSFSLNNQTGFIMVMRLALQWGFSAGVCRIMTPGA